MLYLFYPFFLKQKKLPLLPFYQSQNQVNKDGQTLMNNNKDTNINNRTKKLDVVFAAGPYTLDTDLEFEPFSKLIKKMIGEKHEILVLVKIIMIIIIIIHYIYLALFFFFKT